MESTTTNGSLPSSELELYELNQKLEKVNSGPPLPFSERTFFNIEVVFRIFITGTVAFSGLFSNVINIVMFYRQGFFSHSSVVNLTALAITDFLSCLFCVWSAVCGIFAHFYDTSMWSWHVHMFFVITAGRPYNTVTQITCWITAFLGFERAMSVLFPFKAKSLFTPKRALIVMILLFVLNIVLNIPNLLIVYAKWFTDPKTNRTYVGFADFVWMTPQIETIFFYTSPVTLRTLSVVIVVVCNVIIFWKVYLSQKFRKASAPLTQQSQNRGTGNDDESDQNQSSSSKNNQSAVSTKGSGGVSSTSTTKEMRLVRMITLISAVFMMCYIPSVLHVLLLYIVFDFSVDFHWWVDVVVWNVVTCLQIVNASTNIFIYYNMSTRYREELLLCMGKKIK